MDFLSALLTYGLILICFIAVGGVAIACGIFLRKRKDLKLERENAESDQE